MPSHFVSCRSRPKFACQVDLNGRLFLLQDVSAAFCHRHYHYHPCHTDRLHYLGETATITPCLHCSHPCGLCGTLLPFCYIYAVPYLLYHPHVTLFAARDGFIILATDFPNGIDIYVVRHALRWTMIALSVAPPVGHSRVLVSLYSCCAQQIFSDSPSGRQT